jgi:putative ABC transport system ATP-binding protein
VTGASHRERDRIRRERFGFVFQSGELVPELTILENVSLPLRLLGTGHRDGEACAQQALDGLGIGDLGRRMPTDVSGGELQRAAIARALIHRPTVVLADEPTGALDDESTTVVLDLLVGHARDSGAAVVLVTHDRSLADRTDRVLALRGGSLAA